MRVTLNNVVLSVFFISSAWFGRFFLTENWVDNLLWCTLFFVVSLASGLYLMFQIPDGDNQANSDTNDTRYKDRIGELKHALTQVRDLAMRHTHFGGAREDIVHRANENLRPAKNKEEIQDEWS